MDKAQALSEPYLKIGRIVSRLMGSLESTESNVASVLLRRIRLHELELFCQTFIQKGPKKRFRVDLPEFTAKHFLGLIAKGEDDLKVLSHEIELTLGAKGSDGEWEMFNSDARAAFGGERYTASIPFTEFGVPRSKLEERLRDVGISVPEWFDLTRQCLFYRGQEGQWRIGEKLYSHMDGFAYLRELIVLDGVEMYAWTLYQRIQPIEVLEPVAIEFTLGTRLDGDRLPENPRIDIKAIKELTAKLGELEEMSALFGDRSDAELCPEESQIKNDITDIRRELSLARRPDGKLKDAASSRADRIVDTIRNRIKGALNKIKQNQPHVFDYLSNTIRTGVEPRYSAPSEGAWEFVIDEPGS